MTELEFAKLTLAIERRHLAFMGEWVSHANIEEYLEQERRVYRLERIVADLEVAPAIEAGPIGTGATLNRLNISQQPVSGDVLGKDGE